MPLSLFPSFGRGVVKFDAKGEPHARDYHRLMRVRVIQADALPLLAEAAPGIALFHVGKLSHFLDPGDGLLVYTPNADFSECRCTRACEVTATDPDQGLVAVDARSVDVTVSPDRHARHYWRDRPYLCLDVAKIRKYDLLSIFGSAFDDPTWLERELEDAVNFVFRPDLNRPTLTPVSGLIYLLRGSKLHKIGKSIHIDERKKTIEKDVGETLELLHTIRSNDYTRAEVTLHQKYRHLRRRGEWFELSQVEVAEIMQITEMNY